MRWIAPAEKTATTARSKSACGRPQTSSVPVQGSRRREYSGPILGLIFLRFGDVRFYAQRAKLEAAGASSCRGSRVDEPTAYHAAGVLYLSKEAVDQRRPDVGVVCPRRPRIGGSAQGIKSALIARRSSIAE